MIEQERKAFEAMAAEILRQGKQHNIDDFDSEINWLARCIADGRDAAKAGQAPASGEVVDAIDIKTRIGNWVKAVVADCRKNNAFLCNSEGRLVQEGFEKALGLVEAKVEYFTPPPASQVPEGFEEELRITLLEAWAGVDSQKCRVGHEWLKKARKKLIALLTATPEAADGK